MAMPVNSSKTDKLTTILGAIAGLSAMVASSGVLDTKGTAIAGLVSGVAMWGWSYYTKGITPLPTSPIYPPPTHTDLQSGQPR
jgi:ammonia channel protein AmtB